MASEPTPPTEAADLDPATRAELDQLLTALMAARRTNIGFPAAADFDPSPLIPFLHLMLNNLGDPTVDGAYPHHTKAQERDVVGVIAELLRAPSHDRWGYVTSGASEGTEQALLLARCMYPDAVVYHSVTAHHCVPHAIARLAMPAVTVRAQEHGEVDYDDLTAQIERCRDRPVVLVANIGTAMSEAVDDVRRVTAILDQLAVTRRWVHADAALSGIPLALLDPDERPGFDFLDGADSVIVSGHKFLGAPVPCGVLVVRDSRRPYPARAATYTGAPDSTLTNSRSGLAALWLWITLRRHGIAGLRTRAEQAREVAAYTHARLVEIGWPAQRHRHAFTVVLATPPAQVTEKWALANDAGRSHIVCVPGITRAQIDEFISDLHAAATPAIPAVPVDGRRQRGLLRRVLGAAEAASVV